MKDFTLYPLGDRAITIQFENIISLEVHEKVLAFIHHLHQLKVKGISEWVPAFNSVTVYYDPKTISYSEMTSVLKAAQEKKSDYRSSKKNLVEIPVCYGGELGPDLDQVARHTNLSTEEVIRIHSSKEYLVYLIGFAPGFPYLGGMDERIATPRHATPRREVKAGSVGIAGHQTGIYSLASPGGWQIIGHSSLSLFDVGREKPSLLQVGDLVRFSPVRTL
jgi:inhibitor of KinA